MYNLKLENLNIPNAVAPEVLRGIVDSTQRGFVQSVLQRLEIPGRTGIYRDWGSPWYGYSRVQVGAFEERLEQANQAKNDACVRALEHSTIQQWLEIYVNQHPLGSVSAFFDRCKNVDFTGTAAFFVKEQPVIMA